MDSQSPVMYIASYSHIGMSIVKHTHTHILVIRHYVALDPGAVLIWLVLCQLEQMDKLMSFHSPDCVKDGWEGLRK